MRVKKCAVAGGRLRGDDRRNADGVSGLAAQASCLSAWRRRGNLGDSAGVGVVLG